MKKRLISCEFNIDTACVELKYSYGTMIAINTIAVESEIVDELISHGYVTNRPVLGVKVADASSSQAYSVVVKSNGLPSGSVIIDTIMDGSDLANKGVKEGDMIIKVNGKDMENTDVLLDAIESGKVGGTIKLTICRVDSNYNISTFDVDVKLVEDSSVSETTTQQAEDDYNYDFEFPFGN